MVKRFVILALLTLALAGLAGFAAPTTAAVHHATGVRVRELPIKIEHLLV